MEQIFTPLLGRHLVQHRIRCHRNSSAFDPEVSALFLYPAFEGGKPGLDALIQAMRSEITGFCTTKAERVRARTIDEENGHDLIESQLLLDKARRLFIKATKGRSTSGEGGELLLFAFIEHYLQAPIIFSKMRLKTSTQMPVHGTDGVHARWNTKENRLTVIFGESKVHASISAAMTSAAESVGTFVANANDRKNHELLLTTDHIDLEGIPDDHQQELIRYLHPFATEEGTRREERFAILLAYNSEGYSKISSVPIGEAEGKFLEHYNRTLAPALTLAKKHLSRASIALESVDLFVLPLPSVQEFRNRFDEVLRG